MTPRDELTKIRSDIRQCEEFVALCGRIKELEQLDQSGALLATREKLETQRVTSLSQLEQLQAVLKQQEELLSKNSSSMNPLATEDLKDRIKSERIRGSTLKLNAEEATQQIEVIGAQVQENTRLLQELYATLEQNMEQGLHPNTVLEKLETLRELKKQLDAVVKADYLQEAERQKTEQQKTDRQQDEKRAPPNAVPYDESKFFPYLAEDLSTAKKSVIIMSPFICLDRARQILPILSRLVASGCNVMVRTRPPDEHDERMKREAMQVITYSHRLLITIVQKSNLQDNVAIIDDCTGWEGQISILGPSQPGQTMRRIAGTSNVRDLRRFLKES